MVDTHVGASHPQYRCRRATRCSDRVLIRDAGSDATFVGAPITTPDGICRLCDSRGRSAVVKLPADYAELSMLLAPGGSAGGDPVSGTRDLPVPIRLGVEAVMAELDAEVSWWAESLLDALGCADIAWADEVVDRKRPGARIDYGCSILSYYWADLLQLPTQLHVVHNDGQVAFLERDGLDAAGVFADLHERVANIAGRTDRVVLLPAPCPNCDTRALVRRNGKENIDCRRCGQILRPAEYSSLVTVLSADLQGAAA